MILHSICLSIRCKNERENKEGDNNDKTQRRNDAGGVNVGGSHVEPLNESLSVLQHDGEPIMRQLILKECRKEKEMKEVETRQDNKKFQLQNPTLASSIGVSSCQ